jgi:hypothetical protein
MRLLLLLAFFTLCADLFGQQLDSMRIDLPNTDSLLHSPNNKLDSAQHAFYQKANLLKSIHKSRLTSIDSSQQNVEHTIDSLHQLQLPTEKYTAKLDSLQRERTKTVTSLNTKMEALKSKTTAGIRELGLPPEMNEKIAGVTQSIEGFQLPVKDLNIPDLNLPESPFKNLDGLNTSVPSPFGEVGNVQGIQVPGMDGLNKAGEIGEIPGLDELNGLSEVTEKAGAYGQELKEITGGGNLGDAKELSGAVEKKAAAVAGVGDLPSADGALEEMTKSPVPLPTSPDAAKDQAQQQVQQAVNHFAGKEKQLQEAMDKMSKLKKKYSSLNSLSEIPKKRPNEMRGKPLIERILPGLAMQFAGKGDEIYMDLNPYAGYRFTGRLTAGLGWNHRIAFDTKNMWFTNNSPVYGPRAFGEFKIGKGFSPRAEFEYMNTLIPPSILKINSEIKYMQWVPGAFIGMKKEYQFFRNVKGTGMVMFRLFNPSHKSPYADVINVRVGLEFPMKKKVKQPKAESK